MPDELPVIALTIGDPAGIGPEVVLKALADPQTAHLANWVVVGDARAITMAEQATGVRLSNARLHDAAMLAGSDDFSVGRLDARCGAAGVEYVRIATQLCLDGAAEAMVTAPLNKEAV